jgi:hypothetical protein
VGDCQVGLAGAGRANAKDKLGALHGAHIGVLGRGPGDDGLLPRRDLRQRHLALALKRRQHELVVGGKRHADRALDVGTLHAGALEQPVIEIIQRPAGLIGGDFITPQVDRVATGPRVNLQLLLKKRQVLVKLAKKLAGKTVVFKGEREVGRVRGARCGRRSFCPGQVLSCQTIWLHNCTWRSFRKFRVKTGGAGLRDSHPDNVTDFPQLCINYYRLQPGRAAN